MEDGLSYLQRLEDIPLEPVEVTVVCSRGESLLEAALERAYKIRDEHPEWSDRGIVEKALIESGADFSRMATALQALEPEIPREPLGVSFCGCALGDITRKLLAGAVAKRMKPRE